VETLHKRPILWVGTHCERGNAIRALARAAKQLGISRGTLHKKMKQYGLASA
jgi:DNA-binding protein Fis